MDDRTRVVVTDLGAGLASLWLLRRVRRWLPEEDDTFDLCSFAVGAISSFSIQYAIEHDPVAPKLSRYRNQLLLSLGVQAWNRLLYRLAPSEVSAATGSIVGAIAYRFVFGVVLEVPEGRFQRASPLDRWRRSNEEAMG